MYPSMARTSLLQFIVGVGGILNGLSDIWNYFHHNDLPLGSQSLILKRVLDCILSTYGA